LAAGRKIDAVKLVREQTGLGLKEALETVEAIEREEEPPRLSSRPEPQPGDPLDEVRTLAMQGYKIQAIRRYREINDTSLTEAKAAVEALERGQPIPPFDAPPRQVAPARVEQVRRRMAQLPQGSGSGAGCTRIAIGIAVFIMLLLAGCGQFVRSTALHACAVELISENSTLRQDLGSPITVSSLLLVMGYSSETDFGGNTDRSAGYFTIARGSRDSAWLYVEVYEASSGFYGVRFNPVPNPNDWLFSHSGDIEECSG
jgi:hypothetical protein